VTWTEIPNYRRNNDTDKQGQGNHDLTLCSVCQDEHCTPWQRQTVQFLEEGQPEKGFKGRIQSFGSQISVRHFFCNTSRRNCNKPEQWQCAEEHRAARQQWRQQP
jgi:hypothetical protein